jgi:hypothetical protein
MTRNTQDVFLFPAFMGGFGIGKLHLASGRVNNRAVHLG